MDNYRLMLEVLGEICATRIAPRAAEADEQGARFQTGRSSMPLPRRLPWKRCARLS